MLLEILELPYELVLVDTQNEEHKTEDYIAMHPFGLVPTLTHDGRVIVESGAQMIYLADLVPDKALAPVVGSLDRGTYYEWFVLNASMLEPMVIAGLQKRDDPYARAEMWKALRIVEARIQQPYCLGEQFTAVDILVHWQMKTLAGLGLLHALPKSRQYFARLSQWLDWTGY